MSRKLQDVYSPHTENTIKRVVDRFRKYDMLKIKEPKNIAVGIVHKKI